MNVLNELNENGYCVVNDIDIQSPLDLLNFTKQFCTVSSVIHKYPDVLKVSLDGFLDNKDINWHADGAYLDKIIYTFLYNVKNFEIVPTIFLDTHLILNDIVEDLSNIKFKMKLKNVKYEIDHDPTKFGWYFNNSFEKNYLNKNLKLIKDKRIKRKHPVSNKECLFLSYDFIDSTTSTTINELIKKIKNWDSDIMSKYSITPKLEKNSILIWDNFRLLHNRPKLKNLSFDRIAWRTTGYL